MSTIKFKRSSVPGKIPLATDLTFGEMAVNYADGILYYKTTGNTIAQLGVSNLYSGIFSSTNVTLSNSTTTGALTIAGGVGIGGNLNVGGTIYQNGVAVSGSSTIPLGKIIAASLGYNLP